MANQYFSFKQFTIQQDRCAMKVSTDACLFGAYIAELGRSRSVLPRTILDIGTGTGLLSLMLAQKHPQAQITALELDEQAAIQAKENVFNSPWNERITVIRQDVLHWNETEDSIFDLIICNPPFFNQHLLSEGEQRAMARHDNYLSLTHLNQIAEKHLTDQGMLALLLPHSRKEECLKLFQKDFKLIDLLESADNLQKPFNRVICCFSKGEENRDAQTHQLALHEVGGQRTERWQGLIQDYYLR